MAKKNAGKPNTVVRCVTLPVAVPLGEDPSGAAWTWESFNAAMQPAFRQATDLANWCVRRLFAIDDPTSAKAPKLITDYSGYDDAMTCTRCSRPWKDSPMPPRRRRARLGCTACVTDWRCGDSSPCRCETPVVVVRKEEIDKPPREQCTCRGDPTLRLADRAAWAGCMQSLNIVLTAVQEKYIQQRFEVMVRHNSALLTYRYPQPFPVHNARWEPSYADGGFPTVNVSIPGAGRVELRLKRRADFGRQLAMFKELHDGTAKRGEAALYRDRKGVLLLKMVGHFPRKPRGEAVNLCFLHTDPNALLVAEINGRSVTVTNGDHLKRAHAVIRTVNERHRRFLQRAGEDKKREVRMDRTQRANLNAKVEDRCGKHRARIDTATKQIAAQVARFLERQRVGLVVYDDSVKTFLPDGFAWYALETRLTQLFEGEMGGEWISERFVHLTTDEEKQEWLTRARNTALAGKRAVTHTSRSGSHPAVTPTKKRRPPQK